MGDDGTVSLDIGRASGLGAGSEFTSMVPTMQARRSSFELPILDGLARSSAQIVSPAGAKVAQAMSFSSQSGCLPIIPRSACGFGHPI